MTEEKKNRRDDWFAMGAMSVIALVAITSDLDDDLGDEDKEVKWSATSLIIGLGVAGIAFFAHLLGEMFVGTFFEGLLVSKMFVSMGHVFEVAVHDSSLTERWFALFASHIVLLLTTELGSLWCLGSWTQHHHGKSNNDTLFISIPLLHIVNFLSSSFL